MAAGTIPVPHKPTFHEFTLPSGIIAQPSGANNGYYLFPDGKVRVEINVKGVTANSNTIIINDFPYPPTKAGSYTNGCYGNDGQNSGTGKGTTLTVINDGRIRVFSTSQYGLGLYVEYYP